MTRHLALGVPAALLFSAAALAAPPEVVEEGTIAPFQFQTLASRNAGFDRSAFVYPPEHELAGQVNANTGDVRLDGVVIDGTTFGQDRLQLASEVRIVTDDGVDPERGGGNVTAGYGIGADLDPLVPEGPGSTTPDGAVVQASQGNFNLSSITAVRENPGLTVYEVDFATPTDTLLLWERGNSGDILVQALDDAGNVLDALLVLDGANDGDSPSTYTPTGIVVTTYVQEGFLNQGQQLSSVGLRLEEPARSFRFTAYQEGEGDGAVRYNGPDLKILALLPQG